MLWTVTEFSIFSISLGRWFQFHKCWDAHIVSSPWMSCISLFPLSMSELTFAWVQVVSTMRLHCRRIWFLYLSGKSCCRTTWWNFPFFALDCGLRAPLFHSALRIYHIHQFCVPQGFSVSHSGTTATAEHLLLETCAIACLEWDVFFHLNVTLWMLMITSRA